MYLRQVQYILSDDGRGSKRVGAILMSIFNVNFNTFPSLRNSAFVGV